MTKIESQFDKEVIRELDRILAIPSTARTAQEKAFLTARASYLMGNTWYVDKNRTDTYTEDGSIEFPYKSIKTVQDLINARTVDLIGLGTASAFESCKDIVKIAPGVYTDNLTISTTRYLRYEMDGVEISGNISITQEQLGLSDYYGKVEFVGDYSNRADKGKCAKISGDITFLKSAYDSLAYDSFIGIEITGDVKYGATAGTGYGTWVLNLENTSFSNTAKSITTNFAAGGHCVLIESSRWNEVKSTLTGVIDLYDVNNTAFRNINTTPANTNTVKDCTFTGTVSMIASKTLTIDAGSLYSLNGRSPTLTGMTISPTEGSASVQVALTSANILAMSATPVTIVPAVTGKTIVVDEIVLKMVTTATQYANGTAVEFRYTDGSGAKVTADIAAAVITAGAGTSYTINKGIVTSLTGVVSSPIVITNATTAFDTGTGTGTLFIRYHLI